MSTTLKFLVDENVEYKLFLYIKKLGYDVLSISDKFPSISDDEVLSRAYAENRILITNDKDFGDLIFLNQLAHKGIILLRLKNENVKNKIKLLEVLLKKYKSKLINNFIVVEEDRIRIR